MKDRPEEALTRRERQIAEAYAGGASYKEIAQTLGIAPATVRTHLGTIYRKLGVSSKIALVTRIGHQTAGHRISAATQPVIGDAELAQALRPPGRPLIDPAGFVLSPMPSLAVLPFDNLSGDPEQEYFADGLAEDLITRLSHLRGLRVVSRTSSFSFRGKGLKIQDVAASLGVRHVLEGSVRRAGGRVRITAQLIDGTEGSYLWAQRYDRELSDIFAIQDEITGAITAAIQVKLTDGEVFATPRVATDKIEAWEAFYKGVRQFQTYTPESLQRARGLFQEALRIEPELSEARVYLAWCYWQDSHSWFSPDPDRQLALARRELDELKSLPLPSPSALHLEAATLTLERRYDEAVEVAEHAVLTGPCLVFGLTPSCLTHSFAGNYERGLELLRTTMRQMPSPPNDTIWWLGLLLCLLDDHDHAILAAEEYARRTPQDQHSYTLLALTYAFAGRRDTASASVETLLRLYPDYTARQFRHHEAFRDPAVVDRMVTALTTVGLPD